MEVQSNSCLYHVGDKVADADTYRLYLCEQAETKRQCLFQIVITNQENNLLDRATYILRTFKQYSDALEDEYASVKTDPKDQLNYDLGFPELIDSFIYKEQGSRRVNILAFRNVKKINDVVPLINVTIKDNLRVDLRTSAWIMGKLLKLLDFVHTQNMSVNLVNGGNILIVPKEHYVLILDWTAVQIHDKGVPAEIQRQEIAQVAQAVIAVLGGDSEKGIFPDDEEEEVFSEYTDYLLQLTRGSESSADMAHEKFYEIVDLRWKGFYPFTVKPLS
ncbi:hypothetical protein CL633_04050 [bacterium]|mgnify:CR=1 FL=1|nr:hypothetical protein [bacterium]|tara:strand:- start:12926 stop:13750 length:825 start_codon:yes stop_codon:yes gene_type:complete